jgi:hypothetical protein
VRNVRKYHFCFCTSKCPQRDNLTHLPDIFLSKSFGCRIKAHHIIAGKEKCEATSMTRRKYSLAIAWGGTSLVDLISKSGIHVRLPNFAVNDMVMRHPQCRSIKVAGRLPTSGGIDKVSEVSTYIELLNSECLIHLEDFVRGMISKEPVNKRLELIFRCAARHLPEAHDQPAITSWNC